MANKISETERQRRIKAGLTRLVVWATSRDVPKAHQINSRGKDAVDKWAFENPPKRKEVLTPDQQAAYRAKYYKGDDNEH